MSLCFKLINKETGEIVDMNKVDEEICELLGEPVDEHKYCPILKWKSELSIGTIEHELSWFDSIGLALASGKNYNECRELMTNETARKVIDYLEQHYEPESWYQPY